MPHGIYEKKIKTKKPANGVGDVKSLTLSSSTERERERWREWGGGRLKKVNEGKDQLEKFGISLSLSLSLSQFRFPLLELLILSTN